MSDKLQDYISESLKRGKTKTEIRNALISAGHKEEIVDAAFISVQKANIYKRASIFVGILLVIGIAVYNMFFSDNDEINIPEPTINTQTKEPEYYLSIVPEGEQKYLTEDNYDAIYVRYATTNNDSSACDMISNERLKTNCYAWVGDKQ